MVKHAQTIRRQFSRRIVWMCLTMLWGWRLKTLHDMGKRSITDNQQVPKYVSG